jgi:Icc protein
MAAMTGDVHLLLISDPHLSRDPHGTLRGVAALPSLQRVLAHASAQRRGMDAVICNGDIVNDDAGGYAHFVRLLGGLRLPVYCIPGNHDDPVQLRAALRAAPFQVGGHVDLANWRIVLLDSCVPGQVAGRLADTELQRLREALDDTDRYVMVCVHHHPVAMASRWLDNLGIENSAELFRLLDAHPHVRVLSWGHVHQCFESRRRRVRLLATPSTCVQFLPLAEQFALDSRPPGYRHLTLHADGTVDTAVVWVDGKGTEAARSALPATPPP